LIELPDRVQQAIWFCGDFQRVREARPQMITRPIEKDLRFGF